MEATAQRRGVQVGRVIEETFSTYGAQVAVLLGTAAAVFLLVGLIQGLLAATGSLFLVLLGAVLAVVGSTLYTGFVVKVVEDTRDGKRDFTVGELLSSASHAIARLIGNGILLGLAVAIGLFLLIVPGLYLLTIWAVVAPAIVIERRGAIEAFGRSHELVKGEGWSVFGTILIAFLITLGIGIVTGAIGAAIGDAGRVILQILGNIVAAPIYALVSSIMFFDLGGGAARPAAGVEAPPAPPPPPAPAS